MWQRLYLAVRLLSQRQLQVRGFEAFEFACLQLHMPPLCGFIESLAGADFSVEFCVAHQAVDADAVVLTELW